METMESKISVWVCREEKLVSGLSRRTTCAEVVKVLLEDQNLQQGVSAAMLSGPPESYCIVEKWRGFERILPNKTKILRLWSAWGVEQKGVRFVLVKNDASMPNNGPRSAEARVVLSKENPCAQKGLARATVVISQEKQRRIVRKAFRKLDKINKKREESLCKDASAVEKMETLVHLVISQDHTIRQQIHRIKDVDREIERYESKIHFDRMKMHGMNYVQDTYLIDANPESDSKGDGDDQLSSEATTEFHKYVLRCHEVLKLEERLVAHQSLSESMTVEIQEELNRRWMKRRQDELSNKDKEGIREEIAARHSAGHTVTDSAPLKAEISPEDELLLEAERVKTQLDTSLYIGLRLNTDLEAINGDLDLSQELWDAKERELRDLQEKLNSLDSEDISEERNSIVSESEMFHSPEASCGWVEQARGLSKTCNTNDEDSDTGLSSMHSQDSDNAAICESLV